MEKIWSRNDLLLGLLLAGALTGGTHPAFGAELSPEAILEKRLAAAFRNGTPKPLYHICSPKKRIYLSLPGTGIPAGYVSPDQLHILLGRLFQKRNTIEFRFRPPPSSTPSGYLFRNARWVFREGKQEPREILIRFRFFQEGKLWFLTEIRATR